MTQPEKRSRRRFLADALFLGGGVTAAALLAKNQLIPSPSPPHPVGQMSIPHNGETPDPLTECPPPMSEEPSPAEVMTPEAPDCPPMINGNVAVPPPPRTGGKATAPRPEGEMSP